MGAGDGNPPAPEPRRPASRGNANGTPGTRTEGAALRRAGDRARQGAPSGVVPRSAQRWPCGSHPLRGGWERATRCAVAGRLKGSTGGRARPSAPRPGVQTGGRWAPRSAVGRNRPSSNASRWVSTPYDSSPAVSGAEHKSSKRAPRRGLALHRSRDGRAYRPRWCLRPWLPVAERPSIAART
jgi:hypothetical protein